MTIHKHYTIIGTLKIIERVKNSESKASLIHVCVCGILEETICDRMEE